MKSFLREKGISTCSNKENSRQNLLYSFSKRQKLNKEDANYKRQKQKGNFIDRVNGYIQTIASHKDIPRESSKIKKSPYSTKTKKFQNGASRRESSSNISLLSTKIKAQRQINKNLQKCIIEIQKILWERNQRLDVLSDELRSAQGFIESKQYYLQEEKKCDASLNKIRQSQRQLKKYANSLGLKGILKSFNNDEVEQSSQFSNSNQHLESSNSIEPQSHYIKIERPRTQSESEISSRRKKR